MTYQDLADLIALTGYPVAMPGDMNVALPAFTMDPQGILIDEQFPTVAYELVDVSARVELDNNNPAHWDESRMMVYALLNELRGAPFQFDAEIDTETDTDTYPPSIAYTMRIQFQGEPICQPTVLLIDEDNPDPTLITYLTA